MSFCDNSLPEGERFLGALIVRADNEIEMLQRSHHIGLNPGGEIAFFQIPEHYVYRVPADWIETRLITKVECDEMEKKWITH
jgi:hypothetical protein